MATKKLPPAPRYGRRELAERINRERGRRAPPGEAAPLPVKVMAARIGMSTDDWYKRTGKRYTPFTAEEMGRVAEVLGAPRLWPFAEWDELERLFGALKS